MKRVGERPPRTLELLPQPPEWAGAIRAQQTAPSHKQEQEQEQEQESDRA